MLAILVLSFVTLFYYREELQRRVTHVASVERNNETYEI